MDTIVEIPEWLQPRHLSQLEPTEPVEPYSNTPLEPSLALTRLPAHPRTPDERRLVTQTYEKIFYLSLDAIRGGSNLRFLAGQDHRRIHVGKFMHWVRSDPTRKRQLEEAQAVAAELMMSETIDIADGLQDVVTSSNPAADQSSSSSGMPSDITRDKLRIDARTKLAGFWDPQKYGDIKRVEMTTKDITEENISQLSTAELKRHLMRQVAMTPSNVTDGEIVE